MALTLENWIAVATILLGNGVIAVIITGFISIRQKRTDYYREYYKTVIQKRIKAYELVDELMQNFKKSVASYTDLKYNKCYLFFLPSPGANTHNGMLEVHQQIEKVMVQNTWLSHKVSSSVSDINHLLNYIITYEPILQMGRDNSHYQNIGARYTLDLEKHKNIIERQLGIDWGRLHRKKGIKNIYQYDHSLTVKLKRLFKKKRPARTPRAAMNAATPIENVRR